MSVAEARALCPTASRFLFEPDQSRHALSLLAKWCWRFSPVVALDPSPAGNHTDLLPDGLLLDVTGSAHFFGGEHLFLSDIAMRLRRMGFTARLAIAPAVGPAWALARFGPHSPAIIGKEQLLDALSPLPLQALRLEPATCAALHQVGIEDVGHLLKLPRPGLLTRYGDGLLTRLDQAFCRTPELIEPIRITQPLSVQRLFDGAAIQLEAILITVKELIADICRHLTKLESGLRGLRVELARFNASTLTLEFVVGQPARDAKHLWNLVRPKLENIHMGYGIESVTLTAYWTETICHQQTGAWGTGTSATINDRAFETFLDTLVSRWGSKRVLNAHAVASYVPESARQFQPVDVTRLATPNRVELLHLDRPSILLDPPEPAQGMALQPDHPPSWIKWRGQDYTLEDCTGPERIATAWWTKQQSPSTSQPPKTTARDYFRVRTATGTWLWVFRELVTGDWFVHGIWA